VKNAKISRLTGIVGIIRESKPRKRKVVIEVEFCKQAMAVELEDETLSPGNDPRDGDRGLFP
jgi:hypothetical protein